MLYSELVAVMLQTVSMIVFIATLIPFRFSGKKTAVILGCLGFVLCAIIVSFAVCEEISFMVSYGVLMFTVPLYAVFHLLSTAKGIRFLFVMSTAVLFRQMLSTLLAAFRIWTGGGFTLLYLLLSLFAFGMLITGGIVIRKDFHKIVFTYRYEFACLTLILALLFFILFLFCPISEDRSALDSDLLIITLIIDPLIVLLYIYIAISFHSLGKRTVDTRETTALRLQMQEAGNQIDLLRTSQEKEAFYRHDLRHHLSLIREFLEKGEIEQLRKYLDEVQEEADKDIPNRCCQNEAANLLLLSFISKATETGIYLVVNAQIPHSLPISNPELCMLLSNALENAITATSMVEDHVEKAVHLTAYFTDGKLLIQVENPYTGKICIKNGMPQSARPGHGLGVASIVNIVKRYDGLFSFTAENGWFKLQIAI